MTTLFIRGVNDSSTASLVPGRNGGVNFAYDGSCGVYWFMNFDSNSVEEVTLFGEQVKQQQVRLKSRPMLVFNEISDPDSHHGALKHCEALCEQLQCPVINHPSKILQTTRDNVSRMLQDIPGVRMPKTVRFTPRSPADVFSAADEAGIAFPFIVRMAGQHGGKSCILVSGRNDLDKLHVYPFDGSAFYLTEFVDYAGDDGLYRKYRIVMVDGVPLYRHHLIDRKWMVHASSVQFMNEHQEVLDESIGCREAFDAQLVPRIKPALDEIARRMQLDYFGIDCHIDAQDNILVFEANANMNVLLDDSPLLKKQMKIIREHIRQLIAGRAGDYNQGISLQGS